jgi:lipopolysaccharide/colanic/teichoic acid biosynthesis glycosyltransferase
VTPWLLSIVLAVAIGLVVAEVKGGLHAFARRIATRAARTLPEAHVERWREEWAGDLDGYRDRPISAIVRALKVRHDARVMRRDLRGMPAQSRSSLVAKRMFDIAVAGVLLIAAAPLLAVLMFAVRMGSPGPALFRAIRVGPWGDTIQVIKLRTMTAGLADDVRVTQIGRLLRRTHFDHLPMLLNVLRGDMSLVGPPPRSLSEVEEVCTDYHLRPRIKPGLTGLFQLSSFETVPPTYDDLTLLDEEYAQGWSMRGDLKILLRTAWVVLTRR